MVSTIFDVAAKAGVSISTVTRVIRSYPDVSEKTRRVVLAAAKNLNYTPSITAQSFSNRRSNIIGVFGFFDQSHSEPFQMMHRGIMLRLTRTRFAIHTDNWTGGAKGDHRMLSQMAEQNYLCGLIIMNRGLRQMVIRKFQKNNVPIVSVEYPFPDTDNVCVHNVLGGELAGKYLAEKGYKRIAVLAGFPHRDRFIRDRLRGFQHALKRGGSSCGRIICWKRPNITTKRVIRPDDGSSV